MPPPLKATKTNVHKESNIQNCILHLIAPDIVFSTAPLFNYSKMHSYKNVNPNKRQYLQFV